MLWSFCLQWKNIRMNWIEKAHDINPNPPKRKMICYFTIGEQMSVSLMAMAMHSWESELFPLNAFKYLCTRPVAMEMQG